MRESEIQRAFLQAVAKKYRGIFTKIEKTTIQGFPDLLLIFDHKVVFVEIKAKGQKPRLAQKLLHGNLEALGHDVLLVDDVDEGLKKLEFILN